MKSYWLTLLAINIFGIALNTFAFCVHPNWGAVIGAIFGIFAGTLAYVGYKY